MANMCTHIAALAAAGVLLASGAAAAQEGTIDDPRLHTPGKLTVATGDVVYPPWMMDDNPEGGEGFENALVYALAEELGFAPEDVVWVRETFDQSIAPGAKNYDFAIQQISVTEARAEVVTFSQVYFQPDKAVVALPGSPVEGATSFADLREARWGAAVGTTDFTYLESVMGIEDAAVYDDQIGVFQAMQANQIDATVVALPTALFLTAVQVPDAEIVALLPPDENDRGHGLLFEFGNPLAEWIDEGLDALKERGVIEDLKNTWLVADPNLPVITE
ncbi:ABC transporter substrate-binding protein [Pelagibacterium limicola]|uniref:ABC transporter substrate-binding protein n=1 Tax=Pelagibacterium limicola TaxID=2791022 RepID=UPI0018AFC1FD|nr:ABC transporter substrate-binding protein [Pelagibacterium limicola]